MFVNENIVFHEIQEYFNDMEIIYTYLLTFLDESDDEANYQNLIDSLNKAKIKKDSSKLREFFHLIHELSKNHHRTANFFTKIDKILTFFINEIKKFYSKEELFDVFKLNLRIILFLINHGVLSLDSTILDKEINSQFCQYYAYYFKFDEKLLKKQQIKKFDNEIKDDMFEQYRIKGENENLICELIRNDSIDEFIKLFNSSEKILNSKLVPSIFETNFLLMNYASTLIEYAAFCGSIQIFKFLLIKNAIKTPKIWIFAVHGRNYEIIHLLEENNIEFPGDLCIIESMKCHHNEITNYLINNFPNKVNNYALIESLGCYNYPEIVNCFENRDDVGSLNMLFNYACKFDYFHVCQFLLHLQNFDVNKKMILFFNVFLCCLIIYLFFWSLQINYFFMEFRINSFLI